ncbi:Hypothetical protein NTJ_03127 [Nesidiocoris tenuis]|uniref:Uncharacterized protein n=1 Tax=Nesidiocoris tenuis TaxID=355587 RepID=A0ABN7AG29_9HEMI|nr:Hypothetical protein NTJ_03127 [Nesidiocoris tenuis]
MTAKGRDDTRGVDPLTKPQYGRATVGSKDLARYVWHEMGFVWESTEPRAIDDIRPYFKRRPIDASGIDS